MLLNSPLLLPRIGSAPKQKMTEDPYNIFNGHKHDLIYHSFITIAAHTNKSRAIEIIFEGLMSLRDLLQERKMFLNRHILNNIKLKLM